jgi:monoterpene epsilon-lactone hydrolase
MPSIRARIINALLRRLVRPMWRPELTIDQLRHHAARTDARLARRRQAVVTEAVALGGVPATWFGEPELAARNGTLLYLHGGAWCVHLPALYAAFAARLSDATGLRVLLVDYRLAPEHPFPAAVDDCFNVYRALLGGPTGRPLALAGDSAGGNLSLVTLMRVRDAQLPLPDCAVLVSPATDLVPGGPSMRYNAHADPMFSPGAIDLVPQNYCAGADRSQPALSPLHGDWSRLPPLYFVAGSTEMLLDDAVRAHDRALQAGTDSRIDVWPDLPHVFPLFEMLPEAGRAFAEIVAFIGHHIRHAAVPPLGVNAHHEDLELLPADVVTAEPAGRTAL